MTETLAQQQAAGLRALADMIEAHPGLAENFRYTAIEDVNVPLSHSTNEPALTIAAFVRAAKAHGASVEKNYSEKYGGVYLRWGPIGLHVYAPREQVCERVVTGTETVTKRVKDPAALAAVPEVEVTETVEKFEWVCRPLLVADDEAVSA